MAVTLPEAVTALGADIPSQGLAETIYTQGGLLRALPFETANGRLAHTYIEELTNPAVAPAPINGMIIQGKFEVVQKSVSIKWFGGDVPLDPRMRGIGAPENDFFALAAMAQAKEMRYLVEEDAVNGDATLDPLHFSGMIKLADSTMTIDAGGVALTKALVDQAWFRLHEQARPNALWVMSENPILQTSQFLGQFANLSEVMSELLGGPAMHLHGRPILQTNFTNTEDASGVQDPAGLFTSVYLVGLGGRGLKGVLPPGQNEVFKATRLQPVPGFPHEYLRLMFGMALVLESKFFLVRIRHILNTV